MAVTADRRINIENGNNLGSGSCPMAASATIFGGAMVISANASGNCSNATDAAASRFVGVAKRTQTNPGAAGSVVADLYTSGDFNFNIQGSTLTAANIGQIVVIFDNDTVTNATTAANDIPVGILVRMVSTSECVVRIMGGASVVAP